MDNNSKGIWKYCYWLDEVTLSQLKKMMAEKGSIMIQAEKNPCEALKGKIGYAKPSTWDIICKHDAAPWYHASKHAGKNLVVSSTLLADKYTPFLETTIEHTSFEPEEFPSREDLMKLSEDEIYLSRRPEAWGAFPPTMREAIVKGLAKMIGKPFETFEDLLFSWDAVHSNFINPNYRTGKEFSHAPYSVTDSVHISTCCVELFNLLASKEDVTLVRPCIGSVMVKVLEKDRYYLVRLIK